MPLLDDICRCHDADCPERLDCRRWLERAQGGERLANAESLFPFEEQSLWKPCPNRIPVGGHHSVALDQAEVGRA